ncbi:MAG: hypothetical protein N3E52_01580 [Candidatus Bathyarchaeota archaeon]|nr:hypothetical protein [Candidatus Bathyarchaeota archaeon]
MNKTCLFIVLAVVISLAIGFINAFYALQSRIVIMEDFEQLQGESNLGEWSAKAYVPLDPNNPGNPVQWHIRRVSNVFRSGKYSAEFFLDGTQDDGTIWLERKIRVPSGNNLRVTLSFWLYSEQESFNTIAAVVAYAGVAEPAVEDDFAVIGVANEVAGWRNYAYTFDLNLDSAIEIWVAFGISVRWETCMTYYIDNVKLEFA